MATYSADPDHLASLAGRLESYAASTGNELAGIYSCAVTHPEYWSSLLGAWGEINATNTWAEEWAVAVRTRVALLLSMERVAMGGPGTFTPEMRTWAFETTSSISFEDWNEARLAAEQAAIDADPIRKLEQQIAQLRATGVNSHYTGMSIYFAEQQLRALRAEKYRELEEQISLLEPEHAKFGEIRTELVGLAGDLGLDAAGYAAAADAMDGGVSPADAKLDPLYFPIAYIDGHALHDQLGAEIAANGDRMTEISEEISSIQLGNAFWTNEDVESLYDELYGLFDENDELSERMDALDDVMNPARSGVVAWLDDLPFVAYTDQHTLVGEYLAAHLIEGRHDDAREVSELVELHVNSTAEAVALFNAFPEGTLSVIPWLAQLHQSSADHFDYMQPFAHAMAMASHSDDLEIDVKSLMSDPFSAMWFMTNRYYHTDFLIDAAGGAVDANDVRFTWRHDTMWSGSEAITLDPRVLIIEQLNDRGPVAAEALINDLSRRGLLPAFVKPETGYSDGGRAAGAAVALLGTTDDRSASLLITDVMVATGDNGAHPGVLQGAGIMVMPHVGSFATGADGEDLPGTTLRVVLDGLGQPARTDVLNAFLGEVMSDEIAAKHVFDGFSMTMALAIGTTFDPTDSESTSAAFGDSGRLLDLLASSYLDVNLADARNTDEWNALWQGVISTAIDVTAAVALLGTGGVGGFVAGAFVSAGNNVGLPLLTDFGLSTDNAEGVLEYGYELENSYVDQAQLLLAQQLNDAGIITLPAEWFVNDALEPPTRAVWNEYRLQLEATGFPFDAWFNDPVSIGGHVDWQPGD